VKRVKQPLNVSPHPQSNVSSLRRLRITTLVLVASFAALVVAAGAYNLTQQYKVVTSTTARAARTTLMTVEAHASQVLNETYRVLEGISDVYRHELDRTDPEGTTDEAYLHKLLAEKLKQSPAVMSFFITGPNYEGVAASRSYPMDMTRARSSGVIFETITASRESLMFGPLFYSTDIARDPNVWVLPISLAVTDDSGQLRGYVFAMLRPGYFSEFYATLDVGAHGRIAMWTDDNRLAAATPAEQKHIGEAAPETNAAWGERAGSMNPAPDIFLKTKMNDLPLSLAVTLDADDFLTPWRNTRNAIALAVIGIVLAMTAFAVIILRQLRRTEDNERALRQAKAAAEEANDAKSRFLAHMSHEFRTPLNAIMGFSEIIKNKVLGDSIAPAYTSYADHIHRSGEHLLNIVNDILDMAKIESGVQPLTQEAIDMMGVIRAAVSFVEGMANRQRVSIRVVAAAPLPMVTGDQRFSRQVVINLLSNAIKFSPVGSEIVVAARYIEGRFMDVCISDHGPGIEPSLLKRLGEPFLQGNPSVSHSGQGTGLGLSICKRYMDLLGGELIIDSTIGTGTTAIIRFPQSLLVMPEGEPTATRVA
jgi:signal transduction histidine kinase